MELHHGKSQRAPGAKAPLTGWAKGMHPNGNLKVIGHFIEGKENGPCFVWHPNGTKSQQGGFLEGKRHGLWIHWDESGKETKRENWDNDVSGQVKQGPRRRADGEPSTGYACSNNQVAALRIMP